MQKGSFSFSKSGTAFSDWMEVAMKRSGENVKPFFVLLVAFLLLVPVGCFHAGQPSDGGFAVGGAFNRMAVVPFQQIFPDDLTHGPVESPFSGRVIDSMKPIGNPEGLLETGFLKYLERKRPELGVVSGERAASVFRHVSGLSFKKSLRQALCETAKELNAELVVAGYLYRFRERKGQSFAVEKPASVAFEIVMLRVDNGDVVWRGMYDRTQKSLFEDIFQVVSFLKGKGRWLNAAELLDAGIEQTMQTFPMSKQRP